MTSRRLPRSLTLVVAIAVVSAGIAFALAQVTRDVAATVNVAVKAPDGVEIYLDEGLTEIADSVDFGTVKVDVFGTKQEPAPVPVWIKNHSLSAVELSLDDDYADGDVVLEGVDQSPVLQPDEVLPALLALDFNQSLIAGPQPFTMFFNAEGPVGVSEIIVAQPNVAPVTGLGSSRLDDLIHYIGVGEVTFQATVADSAAPMLATSFTLEPDLSGGTMAIRDDVIFHGQGLAWAGGASWGPMTAADIAYTVNDGNVLVNTSSIHWQAGDFAAMFGANPLVAVNNTTVEFTFAAFDPRWNSNLMNDAGQAFSVQSINLRDTNGEDWMRDHPLISTGPFHILEWVQNDRLVVEKVPYDHWSGTNAQIDRLTILAVGDEATRIALMETGEVDAATISTANIPAMLGGGFETADNGLKNLLSVIVSGTLWETHHAVTGEPLDTSAVYLRELPWIGDPEGIDTTSQTLASARASAAAGTMTDFEQAVLVRNAFARAYDRGLINDVLQAGLGFPNYLNQFSPTNPNWQSKWEYPYDPAESETLLDEAGVPRGAGGVRFEMPLYVPSPGNAQEIADAVAGFFDDVGVKTSVQKFPYSVYRPTIVARATTMPWVSACDDGKSTWPWDWPKSADHTSLTRGGFGCGVEIPVVAQGWLAAAAEPDQAKRIAITNSVADHLFEMAVSPGIVGQPAPITYNPDSISAWPMNPALFATVTDYESIVPAPR